MRRRASLRLVLGLALWAAGAAAAMPQASPLATREIAPGVFVYEAPVALASADNAGAIANLGFVVGRDAVAVIDTGGSIEAGRRLLAAVRQRSDRPIRYVINTHVHPDHVLGNAAFRETGATLVGHHRLPSALDARASAYLTANRALVGPAFEGTEIVAPTLLVERTRDLDLGGRVLRLEAWPTAHSNTDLTVLDAETGTWFLGDLLFANHVPALDGKLRGWIAALRDLSGRPAQRVVPGHGPASLDWPEAAGPIGRYLERLEADLRGMIREGRTIVEAAGQAGRSEAPRWRLFDEFNARNATSAYQELEWDE